MRVLANLGKTGNLRKSLCIFLPSGKRPSFAMGAFSSAGTEVARGRPDGSGRSLPRVDPPLRKIRPFAPWITPMASPSDLRYSQTHEWFRVQGDVVTMGITQFAADQLTDVTYAAMKPAGTNVSAGGSVGEVESVKTTSDVYSAVTGEIIEANSAISADPSLVNSDPYGAGWMVRLRCKDASPLAKLMDAKAYDSSLASA